MSRFALLVTAALVAAPALAHAGNGVDLVRFMPEDSSVYMVVDVAGSRDSDLFKKGMAKIVAMAPSSFALVQSAGLDPVTAIDTLAVGGRALASGHDTDDFVIVAEGKNVTKVLELFSKDPSSKAKSYHGVMFWQNTDAAMALVQKRLFLAKPGYIDRTIDLALGKSKSAAKSPKGAPLRALIATTDTRQDLWAAVVMPADAAATAKASGLDVQGISIGATLSTELALEIKMLNATDASAITMLKQINQALPQLTPALSNMGLSAAAKSLQIDRDGAAVRLAITLTESELQTLAGLLQGAFGGLNLGGP
ncbi:MAG TPA: hypothetical protein VL463_06500 [Kofleriaceae bacterium]|jgi:hypothetical protein|nr:hypothetical protein [Kofleriaceae bacterium]